MTQLARNFKRAADPPLAQDDDLDVTRLDGRRPVKFFPTGQTRTDSLDLARDTWEQLGKPDEISVEATG